MQPYDLKNSTRYEAFDDPITSSDIAAYRASGGENPGSAWIALMVFLGAFSAIFFIGVIVKLIGLGVEGISDGYLSHSGIEEMIPLIIISLAFALLIFPVYFLNKRASMQAMAQLVRIRRFATINGWRFRATLQDNHMAGMLFNAGNERSTYDVVQSNDGIKFMFGTHRYVTGVGRGRSSNEWGFITLAVKTDIAHLVLDAKGNNGKVFNKEFFSNLPQAFNKEDVLAISPEVDELYRAYSIDRDAAAARRILTTDFIHKIKRLSKPYDMEIIDGTVFIYSPVAFRKTKKQFTEIMEIIDLLAEAFSLTPGTVSNRAPQTATERTGVKAKPVMSGHTPIYLKRIGVIAVILQFIALIGLLLNQ